MSYFSTIPNEANLVRGASGDLVRMQANFEHMEAAASGILASSTGLLGWMYGDSTRADRFRSTTSGGAALELQVNTGGVSAPAWSSLLRLVSGGDAEFTAKVSGIDPTDAQHLVTRNYLDTTFNAGLSLSGLSDTAVSGAASGNVLSYDGVDWTLGAPVATTFAGLADTNLAGQSSGTIAFYNGALWAVAASGIASGEVLQYTGSGYAGASIGNDHGALIGLADDDHTQYVPTDASRGFTAQVSGLSPLSGYHLTTKDYVDQLSGLSISGATTLSGLTDTFNGGAVTPVSGQALVFDGSVWAPGAAVAAGGGADVLEVQVFS